MQLQGSFSQAEYAGKKKQTRRDKFLGEMEQVVPWARLVERLRPFYPKGECGRPPIGLERMLRIHFLQQWYGLADGAMEDALYDSQALRGFAGIDLTVAAVPEETALMEQPPPNGGSRQGRAMSALDYSLGNFILSSQFVYDFEPIAINAPPTSALNDASISRPSNSKP